LAGFEFKFDRSRFENPKIMDKKINRALYGVCKFWDGRIEAHMKHNAPWRDRTSNARNGLRAQAVKLYGASLGANAFAIILSHGVTYGIFLELGTRHMHKRPIIVPTMYEYAPKVLKTCTKLLNRLGGG
jgi:HK97 gp10 family phage protein